MKWLSKEAAITVATRSSIDPRPCVPCELARAADPIIASERAVAILDRYACRPGHVLVVLRRHAENIAALDWNEYSELHHLAWQVAGALDRVLAPRRIYIAALGSAEPLAVSFPHVHLHVVPLADGGEADRPANVFTWNQGMYVFESPAEETSLRDRLRSAIADLPPPAPPAT
jgi:diadenosine tetraphosphate (Ap4A) HIT family hydrolase